MPEYRHYRLDGTGTISGAEWIDAADDEHAIRLVRERKLPVPSEIWHGNRLIARVEPPGFEPQASPRSG